MAELKQELRRITIFVLHHDDAGNDDASHYAWVHAWIIKWKSQFQLTVVDYSSGGWEHSWDIEATQEAISEVPADYLCDSEWSNPGLFKK
jgi:hypothetical protein